MPLACYIKPKKNRDFPRFPYDSGDGFAAKRGLPRSSHFFRTEHTFLKPRGVRCASKRTAKDVTGNIRIFSIFGRSMMILADEFAMIDLDFE